MKMVKRILIAIAVVAFMATSVQALDVPDTDDPNYSPVGHIKKDGSWPMVYVALDLCEIPVYMDVGMYVQIKDCSKKKIELKQETCPDGRKFPCYTGCTDISARSNFAAILDTKLKDKVSWVKKWDDYFDGPDTLVGSGDWEDTKVCVDAWEAEIWASKPNDKVPVATLVITVKPL
jgi:hypothetical protein